MSQIEKSRVVLVTTTFVKSVGDMRAGLAIKTCEAARLHGYKIIVVDDSSGCPEFKEKLRAAGALVIDQKSPGMGNSRRECIGAGLDTGADVIVWLEPEKYPLVPLLGPCIEPVLVDAFDLVIPRRKTFTNYPSYQHFSELKGNWAIANVTGRGDLDYYIGPRVMSRKMAELMLSYTVGYATDRGYGDNWEVLFVPVLWAFNNGWSIGSVLVDYIHPVEQSAEDDEAMRAKRDKQLVDLVATVREEALDIGLVAAV